MMNSKTTAKEAYVWIWLPEETTPVVAGKLEIDAENLIFNYGKSYLQRKNAIEFHRDELPLKAGKFSLAEDTGCIRDSAPDSWGRRVIINRLLSLKGERSNSANLHELIYLLESGSDRIGALDFQASPKEYIPRLAENVALEELLESAERVEKGKPLSRALDQALYHGSSIGGARPKALIEAKNKKYIAKFSSSSDIYNLVKAEFIAMRLAKLSGLNVAEVSLKKTSRRDVLLVERFDRIKNKNGWQRKMMLSALTLLKLNEMQARYASYEDFADIIRSDFTNPKATMQELFARISFNILCGNTDDHARNHAAFWDGHALTLTPAYDICPQGRVGNEASQAMLILGENRMSKIALCFAAAEKFLLSEKEAASLIEKQVRSIIKNWKKVCEEAELSAVERDFFWRRQFINPYIFEDLEAKYTKKFLRDL